MVFNEYVLGEFRKWIISEDKKSSKCKAYIKSRQDQQILYSKTHIILSFLGKIIEMSVKKQLLKHVAKLNAMQWE